MMNAKPLANKVFFLGIDGMDPDLTRRLVDEGKMPNVKKLIEQGACKENLHMLGSVPTITPPMWTTIATGCNPNVHGITDFWNQSPDRPDELLYSFDSASCKAETLWETAAKSGMKTLVFHWPGGSWPPKIESEFLHTIDGTSPSNVGMSAGMIGAQEKMYIASKNFSEYRYQPTVKVENGAGCVLSDIEVEEGNNLGGSTLGAKTLVNYELTFEDGEGSFEAMALDMYQAPVVDAHDWGFEIPDDAKEFTAGANKGLERRYVMILKNENGVYDTVKLYRNKKVDTPLVTLTLNEKDYMKECVDTYVTDKGTQEGAGLVSLLDLAEDASYIRMHFAAIIDTKIDDLYVPKSLHDDIISHCGNIVSPGYTGGEYPDMVEKVVLPSWRRYMAWQARALNYLMETGNYQLVFSHVHNCDGVGHQFWHWSKEAERNGSQIDPEAYVRFMEQAYVDTDEHVGDYMHLLDEGWTIILFSDHGFLANKEEEPPVLGDPFGVNVTVMAELGYTVLKNPEEKNPAKVEIDWTKTKAVASRGNCIYLNLKSKYEFGIVEDEDKYDLEEKIIDDLYNYKDPKTGRRIVYLCMRNKDAELVGMSGPDYGDIIYWVNEGFNRGHGDSLPTFTGLHSTSVSPIVIMAGPGIKKGVYTDRAIREVDLAPTAAYLLGLRMPAQCEGAPVYQIIDEDGIC